MLSIRSDHFEGPLDLLLQLIEKEELDITEVSLAQVTDQYIALVEALQNERQVEELADFLVVAARLILLKSKSIVPVLTQEEEDEIQDLGRQLKMYRDFAEATKKMQAILAQHRVMYERPGTKIAPSQGFRPPASVTVGVMHEVFQSIITRLTPPKKLEKIPVDRRVSVGDRIAHIKQMLAKRMMFSFQDTLLNAHSKTEIIVTFLAILELVKLHTVDIAQESPFADISLTKLTSHATEAVS